MARSPSTGLTKQMPGSYDLWLVLLSLLVAILASYTALDLATRITVAKGRAARAWLSGGAFAMGTGIWSMHFIGMLAFSLPVPLGYDVTTTLLSMAIAVLVSGFALYLVSRATLGRGHLLLGGVLMGIGIACMHYTGMAAMQMSPPIEYDPWAFAASLAIAILASLAALWIAFTLRGDSGWMMLAKPASAVIMGFAITGMHYTGMAAARFAPGSVCLTAEIVGDSWVAGALAAVTTMILLGTLLLSVFDARIAAARLAAALQAANAELRHLTLHDTLTKLPNRILLEDRIGQALEECRRAGALCAVLFVDLDRFKMVNDALGHLAGDELLRAVAGRLRSLVRMEDSVARLGGDEFVLLLRRLKDSSDAAIVARKLIAALSAPVRVQGHELRVTSSIGISVYPMHGDSAEALITNADAAMYHIKKSGRNDFRFFAPQMGDFFPERLALENDLRGALEAGQLELHYQPKVALQSGRVTGMEALARWRHPERGLIAPAEFIPLAEETGLIVPVGQWVAREACRQNRAWQNQGLPRMPVAINLSAVQLRRTDLVETVALALQESGLEARFLELEVTESAVMQNASEASVMLERLRRMGVNLAIDDFGTGYSSLSYLKRFPLNALKIDRSFVRDISCDADDAAIVQAIIALAHGLGLKVIAEGVENDAQLQFLRSLGADEYQGYLLTRALPRDEFARWLEGAVASKARAGRPLLTPA